MTKYLCIDYGLAHIGLATSEHMLATPLVSLANDSVLLARLKDLVLKEGITIIICGIPEGPLAKKVEVFAKDLESFLSMPVILHQETLSTQEATQKLREAGASRGKLKDDHAYAACLILEDYLELNNSVN